MSQFLNTAANPRQTPTTEQIAVAAFHLYVENGCQDGRDLDDWLCAEKLLTQKLSALSLARASDPIRQPVNQAGETRPVESRGHSPTRIERGPASREGIRQKMTPSRPGSRQPQWRTERTAHTKSMA